MIRKYNEMAIARQVNNSILLNHQLENYLDEYNECDILCAYLNNDQICFFVKKNHIPNFIFNNTRCGQRLSSLIQSVRDIQNSFSHNNTFAEVSQKLHFLEDKIENCFKKIHKELVNINEENIEMSTACNEFNEKYYENVENSFKVYVLPISKKEMNDPILLRNRLKRFDTNGNHSYKNCLASIEYDNYNLYNRFFFSYIERKFNKNLNQDSNASCYVKDDGSFIINIFLFLVIIKKYNSLEKANEIISEIQSYGYKSTDRYNEFSKQISESLFLRIHVYEYAYEIRIICFLISDKSFFTIR